MRNSTRSVGVVTMALAFAVIMAVNCRGQVPLEEPVPSVSSVADPSPGELARHILHDRQLRDVLDRAKAILKTGLNAGEGYGEVWIRDLATFIELSCEVNDHRIIKDNLLMFFRFQGGDGNIVDGFIPKENAHVNYQYIRKSQLPEFLGHKNTVETDQESSLIQAIYRYQKATGDASILNEVVDDETVTTRMERALTYLLQERYSDEYGLLWGATTADWGDVQPEHEWGVVLDANSHRAIDIYDNAMFLIAIDNFVSMEPKAQTRWLSVRKKIAQNIRTHLWDEKRQKFIPHVYLQGSPFPADFDERSLYYHGGTAVAIEAGLLSQAEIVQALTQMRANVKRSGAPSIGLTVYPPYPEGFFKNPSMRPYSYQNGGDWTWFGGRLVQALIKEGFVREAYREILPMTARVEVNGGFYEWYSLDNRPQGSGAFRGSAGVLGTAIEMLLAWAEIHSN